MTNLCYSYLFVFKFVLQYVLVLLLLLTPIVSCVCVYVTFLPCCPVRSCGHLVVGCVLLFDLLQIVHMRATLAKMDPTPKEIVDIPEALRTTHRQFGGMSTEVWYKRACLALLSHPNWQLLEEGYQDALDEAHESGKGDKVNRTFPWTCVTKACQQVVPL